MRKITLRGQQLIALDILKYFNHICAKNNIKYSLGGGTLIGAVRHQGFIPWDDDIDVYMCRDEYEKFVKAWQLQQHTKYELSLAESIDGILPGVMTKIVDKETYLVETNRRVTGIFIDIFIWDGVPNEPLLIYKAMRKHRLVELRFSSCRKRWIRAKENSLMKAIFSKLSHYFFNKMMADLTLFQKKYPIVRSDYIGLLSDYGNWQKSYMPKTYFSDVVYFNFEGERLPIMNGYHEYLTMYYGNYMTLPPLEERKLHHTVAVYTLS
ncbi:phosphorylcholine transferase LicD [Rodentibacter trehalosifermentans]|uniref:Phosphorylcholine transferase LicD n=1 Tax=Rodentibacter trehalosifermentans TaxID=1908263 RepID=A0A1V3IL22_9PAST|nr:LicD family protein [Rodentibacter trehalosifermentans]OOF42138.1 phosphorylcholine transferase LicD [Rodentibacter trehalosifermentans]